MSGEVIVCRGGPWGGRLYLESDLEQRRRAFERIGQGEPFEYERTSDFETVGKGKEQTSARVWQYTPAAREPRSKNPPRCTRRACTTTPTRRLSLSIGGRPWYGCAEHVSALQSAMLEGVPGATSGGAWVDSEPVR